MIAQTFSRALAGVTWAGLTCGMGLVGAGLGGCSNPPPAQPGLAYADIYAATDKGAVQDVPLKADVPPDVPKEVADTPDNCTCAGLECGNPPGCPSLDCGLCPKGALCNSNMCEADPDCKCAAQECGILPGCGKDCGACDEGLTCLNNFCALDCSCTNLECGTWPGCDKACGECQPGLLCKNYACVPDPKCECKPGVCGVPPGCSQNCGNCGADEKCEANKCTAGGGDCPCNGVACGFSKPSCAKSCGQCQINQFCSANACKLDDPKVKRKFGEYCGPSEECPVPPPGSSQFAQKQHIECMHNQCEGGLCVGGVCTKKCAIAQDQVNNLTGAPGPDGIEDPGQVSQCTGAVKGTMGGEFRCVEQNSPAQVLVGQTDQMCLPGANFAPCDANSDCQAGEVCRVITLLADYQSRCSPKQSNPVGTAGVKGTQACNNYPVVGLVQLCETGWCGPSGCVALCKNNNDCAVLPGGCKDGKCSASGSQCKADADCPKWTCKGGVKFSNDSLTTFQVCQPVF